MASYLFVGDRDSALDAGYLAMRIEECCETLRNQHAANISHITLESPAVRAYRLPMAETTNPAEPPAFWLEALAESEAELAAGLTVPGEVVMRKLRESIARLEAKRAAPPKRRAAPRR